MATVLNTSRTSIQRYEKVDSIPIEVCEQVAELWGMTLLDLLSELGMSEEDRAKKEYLDDMWVRAGDAAPSHRL